MRIHHLALGLAATLVIGTADAATLPVPGYRLTFSDGGYADFCARPVNGENKAIFETGLDGTWTRKGNSITWWKDGRPLNRLNFTSVAGVWHGKNVVNGTEFTITAIGPATLCRS